MTKPQAAFQATYSDWRLIRGRKCVQIVLEVPLEGADVAYTALGGMPDPAKEVWVAVARLEPDKSRLRDTPDAAIHSAATGGDAVTPGRASIPTRSHKPKRAFNELTVTQQAGMLCTDETFQKFLSEFQDTKRSWKLLNEGAPSERAAELVRWLCGVKSRKDIFTSPDAMRVWRGLVESYRAWQHEPEYA